MTSPSLSCHRLIFLALLSVLGTSCLRGPGLFKQEKDVNSAFGIVTSDKGDGVLSGAYNPLAAGTQVFSVTNGDIAGASIAFPQGSLLIPTAITVEPGASLVSGSVAAALTSGSSFAEAGPSITVAADPSANTSQPMSLRIPVSGSAGLRLAEGQSYLVILFKVKDESTGDLKLGVIPSALIKYADGVAEFSTTRFGAFQAAWVDKPIEAPVEVKTEVPIATKRTEKALPTVTWNVQDAKVVDLSDGQKEAEFKISVTGLSDLLNCGIFIHTSKTSAPIYSSYAKDENRSESEDSCGGGGGGDEGGDHDSDQDLLDLAAGKTVTVHHNNELSNSLTFFARFECEEKSGRVSRSPWTSQLTLPAKVVNSGGGGCGGEQLPLTSFRNSNSTAGTGAFNLLTATVPERSFEKPPTPGAYNKIIGGSCNSSKGPVNFRLAQSNNLSVPCTSGQFQISIGWGLDPANSGPTYSSGGASAEMGTWFGSQELYMWQESGGYANVLLYKVNSITGQLRAISSLTEIVNNLGFIQYLSQDIDLSTIDINSPMDLDPGFWLPLGYDVSTPTPFTVHLEGDGKSIKNLKISVRSDLVNYIGIFSKLGEGSRVHNLKIENPEYSGTMSTSSTPISVNNLGFLAGSASCFSNPCRFTNITIDSPTIAIAKSGMYDLSIMYLGSLIGSASSKISLDNLRTLNGAINVASTVTSSIYVGGIVGSLYGIDSQINYSLNSTSVTNLASTSNHTGGVVGLVGASGPAAPAAPISSGLTNVANVVGKNGVGGIAGYIDNTSLDGALSSGTITGKEAVGGIAGGASSGSPHAYQYKNLRSKGTIHAVAGGTNGNFGGLFGSFYAGTSGAITFERNLSTTPMTGTADGLGSRCGGLVGRIWIQKNRLPSLASSTEQNVFSSLGSSVTCPNPNAAIGQIQFNDVTSPSETFSTSDTLNANNRVIDSCPNPLGAAEFFTSSSTALSTPPLSSGTGAYCTTAADARSYFLTLPTSDWQCGATIDTCEPKNVPRVY